MKKKLKRIMIAGGLILVALGIGAWVFWETQQIAHSRPRGAPAAIVPSEDQTIAAIRRGVAFLKIYQEDDGLFSKGAMAPKPAFTALVLDAVVRSPDPYSEAEHAWIKRAVDAMLAHVQEDGGIYTPTFGLANYSTAVSVMALNHLDNPAHAEVIKGAVAFLKGTQHDNGGLGYRPDSRPDLSNTAMTLEALKAAGLDENDEAFKRAAEFVAACQNSSETNNAAWAGDDGGFIYRPGQSKAGAYNDARGVERFQSYGLMSYAGLMSFIHANIARDDPRVESAMAWVRDNYTLDENRHLGDAGLFYYYITMAKALAVYGADTITTSDGIDHRWADELSQKIIDLQRSDGSWSNANGQWMENDTVLCTAYMVRALSICYDFVQQSTATGRPSPDEPPPEGTPNEPRKEAT